MLVRSPLVSYSFTSPKGANIRVCYQDHSGNIGQTFYDDQSGWYPGTNGTVGQADLNNGIAITGWDSGKEERVYFIGQGGKIVERCHSSGKPDWYDGALTGKFTAAHYSDLAVISYQARGTWNIRVYYEDKDNVIREACRDGTKEWFDGHRFPF
ncbi:hypothetical protein L873DRAFT_1801090 [Choiromyces venosus 120613-1]|uniref:Uncharacterized protein n=1 Tax=Choiromyces venosus 120613-1 TaxID=1336337 RepID=A0A3N4K116_9PEZI|nr:hypothetical protein L873DRAFT_1801090 [Choiromyces venosus 120613-1]